VFEDSWFAAREVAGSLLCCDLTFGLSFPTDAR